MASPRRNPPLPFYSPRLDSTDTSSSRVHSQSSSRPSSSGGPSTNLIPLPPAFPTRNYYVPSPLARPLVSPLGLPPPSPHALPPPPPSWPIVIQLEEAPQVPIFVHQPTDVDTFDTRMKRIEAWRNNSATSPSTSPSPTQRARSRTPTPSLKDEPPIFRCTACDTAFSSRQSLKRHAQGVRTPAACRTAVEYFLE